MWWLFSESLNCRESHLLQVTLFLHSSHTRLMEGMPPGFFGPHWVQICTILCLASPREQSLTAMQVLCAAWWGGSQVVSGSADNTVRMYQTKL